VEGIIEWGGYFLSSLALQLAALSHFRWVNSVKLGNTALFLMT